MEGPNWIERRDALAIHDMMIAAHGGSGGLRDPGLLESALDGPKNHFAYGETDMFVLAANYVKGICLNHPFVDGNKRTAFATAIVFLDLNGIWVSADNEVAANMVVGLIQKSETVETFAQWLGDNARKEQDEAI
ncbi:type II toxin-antitoxin system death-on-curing family toxin [bacterium]|nr:type II toxin-antitoxin system death-on-curing family toxin [bacterium]